MELFFYGKKTEKEIFDEVDKYSVVNYKIDENSNIIMKGDNFICLSSLMCKYKGKIDLIYIDPPFNTDNIFYLSQERANTISSSSNNSAVAYTDKMDKEVFLEFLRERLVILRELLTEEGSIYLHIDYKIGHYVKVVMDEIFGEENFKNDITRIKSNPKNFFRKAYGNEKDLILFYAKNSKKNIWNDIKIPLDKEEIIERFNKTDSSGRKYTTIPLHAPGETKNGATSKAWRNIPVPAGRHWRTDPAEFDKLDAEGHIEWSSTGNPRIKKYADEHKGKKIQDIWKFKDPQKPIYPTEKNLKMIETIILQSSLKKSIVLDCFAGSGSTLLAAQMCGRRWIGIDNSEHAIKTMMGRNLEKYQYIDISKNISDASK